MTKKPAPKPDPHRQGGYLPNGARAKAGLHRAILAQGWGLLVRRTQDKAPGRVEKVRAAYTSMKCSTCGWIDRKSRDSQAGFCCVHCGYTCNADHNAAMNIAAGHAGGTTLSVREPLAGAL
jgi:transposase